MKHKSLVFQAQDSQSSTKGARSSWGIFFSLKVELHYFFTIALFAQKYKWSSVNCQGRFYLIKIILRLTNFPSCGGWGGIALLQVALCYRNQDVLWPHRTVRVIWCQEIMAKIRWFLLWEWESETVNFKFNIFISLQGFYSSVAWLVFYLGWWLHSNRSNLNRS